MRRIRLTIAYDGTNYRGWQIQQPTAAHPEGSVPTIQGELQRALGQLLPKEGNIIPVVGASRTDSGVHALGNVACFDTESTIPASDTTAPVDAGASVAASDREVTSAGAETLASEAAPQKTVFRFYCEDQGCGMSEETLHRVGMAFTQGEETSRTQYQGAGLGLAITKQLVDRMGGQMKIESTLGVGTKLMIELPFVIGEQNAIHPEGQNIDEIPVAGIRALVVEDNELNRELATFMLENQGIEVTPAVDGQEAVEIFENSGQGYFGVIYMDIMMPRMNGLDATRAIRAMKRRDAHSIPIIAMSANAFADDIINGRLAGMNRHLAKPVDEAGMIRALRECMSETDVLKLSDEL